MPIDLVSAEDQDKSGRTPLHRAVDGNRVGFACNLLEKKADLEARDLEGKTPLHCAIEQKREEVARVLLRFGACVNACVETKKGVHDVTSLPLAMAHQAKSSKLVALLIEWQACLREDSSDQELLCWAIREGYAEAVALVKARNGVDVMREMACVGQFGTREIAESVIGGADQGLKDACLHSAAKRSNLPVVETLLSSGADANSVDIWRCTPLHRAVSSQHVGIIERLLQADANPALANSDAETPLHTAMRRYAEKLRALKDPMLVAQEEAVARTLTSWISGAVLAKIVGDGDVDGFTPLQRAVQAQNQQMIVALAPYVSEDGLPAELRKSIEAVRVHQRRFFATFREATPDLPPELQDIVCALCGELPRKRAPRKQAPARVSAAKKFGLGSFFKRGQR